MAALKNESGIIRGLDAQGREQSRFTSDHSPAEQKPQYWGNASESGPFAGAKKELLSPQNPRNIRPQIGYWFICIFIEVSMVDLNQDGTNAKPPAFVVG